MSFTFPPPLRGIRAAMVFLTRIPLGGFPYAEEDWQWASAYFPLVGMILGALLAGVHWTLSRTGAWVSATIVVAIGMLLTGAFHEDGLADTADAMGGAYDREKLFVILKDSRIGSFGAAALAIVLLLRVALLARLFAIAPLAIVLSQSLARTGPVWLMVAMPYVTADAASKSRLLTRARPLQAVVATVCPGALLGAGHWTGHLNPLDSVIMLTCLVVTTLICAQRFSARAGGITGDFLGAAEQIGECAVLLGLAWARGDAP